VAGGARDERPEAPRDRHHRVPLHEGDRIAVALHHSPKFTNESRRCSSRTVFTARMRPSIPAMARLLAVEGVPLQHAVLGARVGHEPRAVEGGDGVPVRHAGRDHLAPPRVAGHEVRLDEPGDDLEVGAGEAPVDS